MKDMRVCIMHRRAIKVSRDICFVLLSFYLFIILFPFAAENQTRQSKKFS